VVFLFGGGVGAFIMSRTEHTYDECILERLPSTNNTTAAAAIVSACRSKFPDPGPHNGFPSSLHTAQLAKITGRAGVLSGTSYGGNLYNGNNDIVVTDLDVAVSAIHNRDTTTHLYRIELHLPPLAVRDFRFDIVRGEPGANYHWAIVAARGFHSFRLSDLLGDTLR